MRFKRRTFLFCTALILVAAGSYIAAHEEQPESNSSMTVSSESSVLKELGNGLYSYKGIDTRRGPQCVEYAERFYVEKYPGTFPFHNSGPGAYDIWEGVATGKDVGGWDKYRKYYAAYENGKTVPKPDDMLLFDRTRGEGWGHIAIIAEVRPKQVVILEQNSGWDTRKVLPLKDNMVIDRGVKGVIRLKTNDK